jgi:hypothetical protein
LSSAVSASPRGQHLLGLFGFGLGSQLVFAGQVLVQEGLDLAFGQGAHEAVHRLAVHHQHAGGDAADAEGMPASCCSWSESILTSLKRPA